MNLDEIKSIIANTSWFSALGSYPGAIRRRHILNLHAWDGDVFSIEIDSEHKNIASFMDWLPTSRDQDDPIYGSSLKSALSLSSPEDQSHVMAVYKLALKTLRNTNTPKLKSGPNDFAEAAIGAALYCSRMAAIEVVVKRQGFWCDLLTLYGIGHWPCGRMPDGDVVVY